MGFKNISGMAAAKGDESTDFLNPVVFSKIMNRPFYSCVLSYLAMNASEAGGDLALIQTFKLFSCKCKLVSMRTT